MLKKTVIACLVLLASCSPKNGSSQNCKAGEGFLYVIISNHGEIRKAANNKFELVLDHGSVEKVLLFSDRPARIVKHETAKLFAQQWKSFRDFRGDPPNATVIINQKLQTVILETARVENDKTIFTLSPDDMPTIKEMSGTTQVFVDWGCICSGHFGVSCSCTEMCCW